MMSEDGEILEEQMDGSKDLVVVGASAGGVGALSVFVSTLHKEFPAPIVLAQHLDPQRPSHLASILERRSALPIVTISDPEPTKLEKGKVYVVPANRHVAIRDGHVRLEGDHEGRPRPSVDLLLSSAAEFHGEHLIAVILTGSGSDGAAGAVDVKNAGGIVIIQNPETAPYPSMPMSLPPTAVDHVVEVEDIGPLIYDLISGVKLVPEEQDKIDDPLRELLSHVSRHTNIDFRHYKPSTIMRRISRRMAVTHNNTMRDYAHYLETHRDEMPELVKAFLIKVTGFFRDPEAFEHIREFVLPDLIERNREQGNMLRIWSAGCATGEEAYSLAILLADLLGAELSEWSIKIFATDLDEGSVNFARRGLYPANVLKNLPDGYQERYFEPAHHGYRIAKSLRSLVIFGHQNLSQGVPFPRMDLVVCRNLLIYLKPELQQSVLDLFAYSLHQTNGYLFLGKAETARPTKATFEQINKKWKIYRCMSGPISLPPNKSTHRLPSSISIFERQNRQPTSFEKPQAEHTLVLPAMDLAQLRRFNEMMLRYLPLGVVIIDRSYRILTVNGGARRLLGIREIANEQDFLHTARGLPYAQVRNAIDMAFREHSPVTLNELELDSTVGGEGRFINLTVTLMQLENESSNLAVISVLDTTEQVQSRHRLETSQSEQAQLVGDLSAANKRYGDINKELQDANEELQAANEELMLTQEELQATNEEFEATNEEFQATNEELETNNEELQATNEELQTTNDELTARTNELAEMAGAINAERKRLLEMVEMAPFYIMLLKGPGLTVEAFNPRYTPLFEGRDVTGLPFEDLFRGEEIPQFVEMVREAFSHNEVRTTPRMLTHVPDTRGELAGNYFVHTIVPTHDGEDRADGVAIYTEEVKEREARESRQRNETPESS